MDFSYKLIWPDRCCGNCAYSSFTSNGRNGVTFLNHCSWMDFAASRGKNELTIGMLNSPDFDRCGLCDKWCPRQLALCAKDSTSFDEFKLKKLAFGFEEFQTDEFDDWFAERKATSAQLRAVAGISDKRDIPPPPMVNLMEIDDLGRIHALEISESFYTVQNWLSKNMDDGRENPRDTLRRFVKMI